MILYDLRFFQTFQINTQKDMDVLLKVFQKYMWCKKCTSPHCKSHNEHEYCVDTDDILSALFELRNELRKEMPSSGERTQSETLSRMLDSKEVAMFWMQFEGLFPKHLDQLWTGLEYGLKQYLVVLRERETLFEECEQLRQQNSELMKLLQNYN